MFVGQDRVRRIPPPLPLPWLGLWPLACAAAVGASLRGCRSPSHRGGASVLEELLHDRGVGQRGDVAHVSFVTGDFAEHPAHDLTCTQRRTQVMTVFVCLM